jgi:hypothetical protein
MSQLLTITQSNPLSFGEKKRAASAKPVSASLVSRITLNFLLVALICAAGVFYISEINNVATFGYRFKSLEKQIEDLKVKNENLKIREAELRSMYNIEEKTKNLNMTVPTDISYISLPGNMAMR